MNRHERFMKRMHTLTSEMAESTIEEISSHSSLSSSSTVPSQQQSLAQPEMTGNLRVPTPFETGLAELERPPHKWDDQDDQDDQDVGKQVVVRWISVYTTIGIID
uniref:Uncharacterized protein n=1 Tax=Syphacia muris TaxID=451379 RepID=A0A0N5AI99_9BILA